MPARQVVCLQFKQGKQSKNLEERKERSLRKCWLVYADSPVEVLPKLLLWELLWTLPAPSGSYQCSHVFLLQSPSAVCSARRTGGLFPHHRSYTHPHFKEEKMHCCSQSTTFRLLSDTNIKMRRLLCHIEWLSSVRCHYIVFFFLFLSLFNSYQIYNTFKGKKGKKS